jgi:Tol biopolymer transport system component
MTPARGSLLVWTLLACNASAQVTERASVSSAGTEAHGRSSSPVLSADGRYVAFVSGATDLVPGDANGCADIFVRDRLTGTTELVSVATGGAQGNGDSDSPTISADGRFVAFRSFAPDFVAGDTNACSDIFVRDRIAGTTVRASVDSAGIETNAGCSLPSISANGSLVAFASSGDNLVPGDTNFRDDVFLRDIAAGTTERVSLTNGGAQANSGSDEAILSPDGRFVSFDSDASNLVPGDGNVSEDVFVRDRLLGTTERVSVSTAGVEGNDDTGQSSISADGRFVSFYSIATNLVPNDTNGLGDVFVHDRLTGTTERVSIAGDGSQANLGSISGWLSGDGRTIVFVSYATNLAPGDTNSVPDIYLHDRVSGATERVSIASDGTQADLGSTTDFLSADGRWIAFGSDATTLAAGDTNGLGDVFVHDRFATGFSSLCEPGAGGVSACPCSNPPTGSGRGCDNSSSTGGAALSATGVAYLSIDSLVFTTSGEKPNATSILLQGDAPIASGLVFGQGLRCAGGALKRLYTKTAVAGAISAPDFGAGDPAVSARSALLGDSIPPGSTRWYLVYYRDPLVLGACPATSTFNATQTAAVLWQP